jgi:DNA-binding XRE family transcriptional regulator
MPCFDLSGFSGLSQGLFHNYLSQWNTAKYLISVLDVTFERIYYFNSNVSTQHSQGNLTPIYYNFINSVEATNYNV